MTYVFLKSGALVKIFRPDTVLLNGKIRFGHIVKRLDSGKAFFAPHGSLRKYEVEEIQK